MDKMFQFLIGTLKTFNPSVADTIASPNEFQFLIGTLKTWRMIFDKYHILWVSIPYRYAKNKRMERIWRKNESKFQFLIGTLKTY